MNGPEKDIDRILAGLREAQPRNGLSQRVLRAVEDRPHQNRLKPQRAVPTGLQGLPFRLVRVPVWVTGLALLAVFFAMAVHQTRPGRGHPNRPIPPPATAHEARSPAKAVQASVTLPRPARTRNLRRPPLLSAEESLAMAEMNAPSLLAPPLPLTAQERALSCVGQRHGAAAAAVLNADHRAREQAEATTEFYAFFEPARGTRSNN
ncbi:MAG: hypothetical protein ACRYFU_25825 [Janthinobacterium lividum]